MSYDLHVIRGPIFAIVTPFDAANGMIAISDNDISSDVKSACKIINEADGGSILSAYNPKTKEVVFHFTAINGIHENFIKAFIWNEEVGTWKGDMEYVDMNGVPPEKFEFIGRHYVSFLGTTLWKHEENELRNVFYGNQVKLELSVVFNVDPIKGKLYKVLEYMGRGIWSCPEKGNLKIPLAYSFDSKDLVTRLKENQFKRVTGKNYATILKDMESYGVDLNELKSLLNGRDMKGNILYVTIVNNDNTEAFISTVSVLYQPIELS